MHTAMANFLLLAVSTFAIVQLFPAMTLAQPRIPSAFSAQVIYCLHSESHFLARDVEIYSYLEQG